MPNRTDAVDLYLDALEHPLLAEIKALRSLILQSNPQITERIKWNAPSFCFNGDDRVTFRLQPKNRLQLIFHRGAKVKDSSNFTFEDGSGLLEWAAADRAVVTLRDAQDVQAKQAALVAVVNEWMQATSDRA